MIEPVGAMRRGLEVYDVVVRELWLLSGWDMMDWERADD